MSFKASIQQLSGSFLGLKDVFCVCHSMDIIYLEIRLLTSIKKQKLNWEEGMEIGVDEKLKMSFIFTIINKTIQP